MSKGVVAKPKAPSVAPSRLIQNLTGSVSTVRHGEGHKVNARGFTRVNSSTGRDQMIFGMDLSSAPVPSRRYAADICDVKFYRNEVLIIFGQDGVFGGLDSVLQVRMSPTAANDFYRSLMEMNGGTVKDTLVQINVEPLPLTPLTAKPEREAKVVVNFASVAISGFETCIDFYHASPFAFRHLAETGDLYVEPIARVDIQTALFASLVEKLEQLVPELTRLTDRVKDHEPQSKT